MSLYGISNLEEISKKIFMETTQLMDKNLRNIISPQLVEQYPILKLIWKDGNFKIYTEIIKDESLQKFSNEQSKTLESSSYSTESISARERAERLYSTIIQSDPMLYLESLFLSKQFQYFKIKDLFSLLPTLLNEYSSQISEIFSRKSSEIDDSQISFFSRFLVN